jgi:hypothetical protein
VVLRKEADSIQGVMNKNILRNANNMDYNINPLHQSAKVEQNKSLIDMQISISLYGEIVKNLNRMGYWHRIHRRATTTFSANQTKHWPNSFAAQIHDVIHGVVQIIRTALKGILSQII